MNRILSLILTFVLLLSFTACSGNFAQVDLKEPIAIPENGIVEKSVFDKVKSENAIATFTGKSNDIQYEWTVFGADIETTKNVNLSVEIIKSDNGYKVAFFESDEIGFPALLSIKLNEKWQTDSATAYKDNTAVYSVSITGSKTSILNISVNKIISDFEILPDKSTNDTSSKNDDREYSNGQITNQDQYQTDPIPEGKPMPVEPEDQDIDKEKSYTCTFSIECSTILNNLKDLDPDKRELVPSNGVILASTKVTFYEGESVFDVLQRVCKEKGIHLESSWTPIYNSAYIEGIHNLYEFDCGALSGWMYRVDGWYPNYGCSRYQLKDGEKVEWRYTCDLGKDVGCDWLAGTQ